MTPSQKFVLRYFPDAKCEIVYLREVKWYVISADFDRRGIGYDYGASRKSEMLAWRNAVTWVRPTIQERMLEKLES